MWTGGSSVVSQICGLRGSRFFNDCTRQIAWRRERCSCSSSHFLGTYSVWRLAQICIALLQGVNIIVHMTLLNLHVWYHSIQCPTYMYTYVYLMLMTTVHTQKMFSECLHRYMRKLHIRMQRHRESLTICDDWQNFMIHLCGLLPISMRISTQCANRSVSLQIIKASASGCSRAPGEAAQRDHFEPSLRTTSLTNPGHLAEDKHSIPWMAAR